MRVCARSTLLVGAYGACIKLNVSLPQHGWGKGCSPWLFCLESTGRPDRPLMYCCRTRFLSLIAQNDTGVIGPTRWCSSTNFGYRLNINLNDTTTFQNWVRPQRQALPPLSAG